MSTAVVNEFQPSLTEWFSAIGEVQESNAFREEDNRKVQRLESLYEAIGLPYERPERFPAVELSGKGADFMKLLAERGDELCALRLVPDREDLPKLRIRGLSIKDSYESWFPKQAIDPNHYTAYVCPHTDKLIWSMIFVVNKDRVFGEIVRGLHSQLTQGTMTERSVSFQFDYSTWSWSADDAEAQAEVKRAVALLKVADEATRRSLQETLGATFSHGYLHGYFETTVWPDGKLYFIDYNRLLPKYIPTPPPISRSGSGLRGLPAHPGTLRAAAVTVAPEEIATVEFPDGAVLVCDNTDVRYLPLMRKAGAVLTERGGTLSHAAIIARELRIPCVVGVRGLLAAVATGDMLQIDAAAGTVKKAA